MTDEFRRVVRRGYDELGTVYHEERNEGVEPGLSLVDALVDRVGEGATVLDVGCGSGVPFTRRLSDRAAAVGLDVSREQLRLARENVPGAARCQGEMTRLPVTADAVDGLLAMYSVIHVPREDHAAVFEEFHRVLRPGGLALVTVGPGAWEGTNPDWLETGVEMRWSFHGAETSRDLLRDPGFTVLESTTFDDELGGGEWCQVLARA